MFVAVGRTAVCTRQQGRGAGGRTDTETMGTKTVREGSEGSGPIDIAKRDTWRVGESVRSTEREREREREAPK